MNIFKSYVVNNEIIVPPNDWEYLKSCYTQEHIIQEISDAIVLFEIKLPYKEISIDDVNSEYFALKNTNNLISDGKWVNKFEYKSEYFYLDKYINISNVGNKASDFFHQVERWKCDATGYPSPQKTWETEQYRLTLFKALFSLKVKEINPTILRNLISLRKYIASQFRPSAAKAIYDYYKPEKVLDLSMGWGDRILGAYASESVKRYVGIDPNYHLYLGYLKQVSHYRYIDIKKSYRIMAGCAEDENKIIDEEFDMIFTSPPYYDKEKYDQSEDQSYIKYKKFDSWMTNFLFKMIEIRSKNLKSGGHLIINISDIYTRKKHYKICDGMNDYIASTGLYDYVGAIGFRMPKRPQSISSDTVGVFAEPVWIWKKK